MKDLCVACLVWLCAFAATFRFSVLVSRFSRSLVGPQFAFASWQLAVAIALFFHLSANNADLRGERQIERWRKVQRRTTRQRNNKAILSSADERRAASGQRQTLAQPQARPQPRFHVGSGSVFANRRSLFISPARSLSSFPLLFHCQLHKSITASTKSSGQTYCSLALDL